MNRSKPPRTSPRRRPCQRRSPEPAPLLAALALAAAPPTARAQITPERPLATQMAAALAPGTVQGALGIAYLRTFRNPVSGLSGDLTHLGAFLVRVGVASNVELSLSGSVSDHLHIRNREPSDIELDLPLNARTKRPGNRPHIHALPHSAAQTRPHRLGRTPRRLPPHHQRAPRHRHQHHRRIRPPQRGAPILTARALRPPRSRHPHRTPRSLRTERPGSLWPRRHLSRTRDLHPLHRDRRPKKLAQPAANPPRHRIPQQLPRRHGLPGPRRALGRNPPTRAHHLGPPLGLHPRLHPHAPRPAHARTPP